MYLAKSVTKQNIDSHTGLHGNKHAKAIKVWCKSVNTVAHGVRASILIPRGGRTMLL